MNVDALFEKLLVDLASQGVREGADGGARVLESDGAPFARLRDERMAFRFSPGTAALDNARALSSASPTSQAEWVEVGADDVREWPRLAQESLTSLRREA